MEKTADAKRFDGVQQRAVDIAECDLRVVDEEKRIVELSFSSETPILRWGDYEVLSHKTGAVMLERINTTGCLLYNHNRDKVIGKVIKAQIKSKRGIATVQFDDDEESTVIYNKVKNKSLRGTSVGYVIYEMERVTKGKGSAAQTTYTATRWEPLEISIVSVPADISVGVGRSVTEAAERGITNVDYQIKINQNKIKVRRKMKK